MAKPTCVHVFRPIALETATPACVAVPATSPHILVYKVPAVSKYMDQFSCPPEAPWCHVMKLGLYARDEYTQHSINIFESDVSKLTGVDVPRFIHVLVVPGKYTAVLLVGAFVTSAALP